MYTFIIVWLPGWEGCQFLPRVAGMAMDKQAIRSDVEKLRELLDHTTGKSKKQKEKTEKQLITYENLEQYPYLMQQTVGSWIGIRCRPCIAFALASPHSSSTTPSLLSGHPSHPLPGLSDGLIPKTRTLICPCGVVFIDAVIPTQRGGGARAGQPWERSQDVCVFCCGHLRPPKPSLGYHPECCRFLPGSVRHHPTGWSLQWLVHPLQTALLQDIVVLPRASMHTMSGIAHVRTIWRSNCPTPALPRHCWL